MDVNNTKANEKLTTSKLVDLDRAREL